MAKHGAFVAIFNAAVWLSAVVDGVDEVCEVLGPAVLAFFALVDELAVCVEKPVPAVFEEDGAGVAA